MHRSERTLPEIHKMFVELKTRTETLRFGSGGTTKENADGKDHRSAAFIAYFNTIVSFP
jgi:hypothetical protein